MCYDTHCTVHNMIIDIWIINKNFLQPFHILMRCEELQICLNITDTSSLNQVSNHHCQPFTKLLDILQPQLYRHDYLFILDYTMSQKKGATLTMAITLSILDRFAKFFHCYKQR